MAGTAGTPEDRARELAGDPMVHAEGIDGSTGWGYVAAHAPRPSAVFYRQLDMGQELVPGLLVLPESSRPGVAFLPDAEYEALIAAPLAPEAKGAGRRSDARMLGIAFGLMAFIALLAWGLSLLA